jgi:enamine deaminase RidA (YjgF/YER057c/UK114 family)
MVYNKCIFCNVVFATNAKGSVCGECSMIVTWKSEIIQCGATMNNIVDEILFVTDMDAAFSAAVKCREEVFSGTPVVASTIVQIQRLAFPDLLIEIRCVARI